MISFLKTWINQIIVAVIITTIIEMILPNGNNKKYIKMVIGLYILFTIIQPVITKFTGDSIDISNFDYKKYFNSDVLETSSKDFENNNSKLIKQAYINNIKEDIENKIEQKGYKLINCNINILDDETKETYGAVQSISLKIKKQTNKVDKSSSNIIKIENINVGTNNNTLNTNTTEKSDISSDEKKQIIQYLSEEYSVDTKNIVIN